MLDYIPYPGPSSSGGSSYDGPSESNGYGQLSSYEEEEDEQDGGYVRGKRYRTINTVPIHKRI